MLPSLPISAACGLIAVISANDSPAFADENVVFADHIVTPNILTSEVKLEVLNRIAEDQARALSRIQTMTAEMSFEKSARFVPQGMPPDLRETFREPHALRKVRGGFSFYYDRRRGRTAGEFNEQSGPEWLSMEGDLLGKSNSNRSWRWQLVPEHYAHVDRAFPRGQLPGHQEVTGIPDVGAKLIEVEAPNGYQRFLDLKLVPQNWYSSSMPFHKLFSAWVELAKQENEKFVQKLKKGLFIASISEGAVITVVEVNSRDDADHAKSGCFYRFDPELDCAPLLFEHLVAGVLRERRTWEWHRGENDVIALDQEQFELFDDEGLQFSLKLSMDSAAYNESIDDSVFELPWLSEGKPVRVLNTITDTLTVLDEKQDLVSVEDYNDGKRKGISLQVTGPERKIGGGSVRKWFLIGNIALIVFLTFYLGRQRVAQFCKFRRKKS